jgi:hypothetical protein
VFHLKHAKGRLQCDRLTLALVCLLSFDPARAQQLLAIT